MTSERQHPVVGHYFSGPEVLVIYNDPEWGQYYLHPVTKAAIYSRRLADGQTWGESGSWFCTTSHAERIATHEAGHAAICCIEGIKIEYVTIEPFESEGRRFSGMCQVDHNIRELRRADPCVWAEKEAKMLLGGMEAEKRYLRERGQDGRELHPDAWSDDLRRVRERVRHRADALGLDEAEEFERLANAIQITIANQDIWDGICRVANRLTERGAVCGTTAANLFHGVECEKSQASSFGGLLREKAKEMHET